MFGEKEHQTLFATIFILAIPLFYFGLNAFYFKTDEFIYYQMGVEILNGSIPYNDFFLAHMPLFILPIPLSFLIFGKTLFAAKIIPIVFSLTSLTLTFLLAEKIKKNTGVIAALILYVSPSFQLYSHAYYGVNLAASLALAAIYLNYTDKKMLSGFFTITMLFARLNTLPIALALIYWNKSDKKYLKGILLSSPLSLFFIIPNMISNTVLYHLMKNPMPFEYLLTNVATFFMNNWLIFGLFALPLIKRRDLNQIQIITIFFYFFTLVSRNVFSYYLSIALPFAVVSISNIKIDKRIFSVLFIVWIVFNAPVITYSYGVFPLTKFEDVLKQTGGDMLCMMRWCPYLHFQTGKSGEPNLLDLSDARFQIYPTELQSAFKISKKNDLSAFIDLGFINRQKNRFGIDFSHELKKIYSTHHPRFVYNSYFTHDGKTYLWRNDVNHIIHFVKPPQFTPEKSYYAPTTFSKKTLQETFLIYDGVEQKESFTSVVTSDDSQPGIPAIFTEGADYPRILPKKIIHWPIRGDTHYHVDGDLNYDVWISFQQNDSIEINCLVDDGGKTVAHAIFIYDTKIEKFVKTIIYSTEYGGGDALIPLYIQTLIEAKN